jgi:hypothetical protein
MSSAIYVSQKDFWEITCDGNQDSGSELMGLKAYLKGHAPRLKLLTPFIVQKKLK